MHVTQNWPNLEKSAPFLQFSSKLSEFFFWWKISKISKIFFLFIWMLAFGSILFCYDGMSEKWMTSFSPIILRSTHFMKSFWDLKSQILETTKYALIRPSFYTHRKSNDIEDANSWKKKNKVSLINWLVLQQSPFNIFSPVLAFKVNLTLNRCGIYQFTILWIQYSALAGRGK